MRRSILFFLTLVLLTNMSCKDDKKYHDTVKAVVQDSKLESIKEILAFQNNLNEEFKNPETSPLADRYRKTFTELDFFSPDTSYRVVAQLTRTPEAIPFMMPTTTDRTSREVVYGIASFELQEQHFELEVYQNQELMLEEGYEDYLFLPFMDKTNGNETYTGGRYIDLSIPAGNTILIDFNKAYNPSCAYNKKYSCPIVPQVNLLDTNVLAGVKAFKK